MDDFIDKPLAERRMYIEQGVLRTGLAQTIIEKDFWVCWLIRKLFSLGDFSEHLIFKGGTSLSKAYSLIQRFSEDIDISIDRAFLGFHGKTDPLTAPSRTARERRVEELQAACGNAIKQDLVPALTRAISQDLKKGWSLEIDKNDPLAILFHFPSALQREVGWVFWGTLFVGA